MNYYFLLFLILVLVGCTATTDNQLHSASSNSKANRRFEITANVVDFKENAKHIWSLKEKAPCSATWYDISTLIILAPPEYAGRTINVNHVHRANLPAIWKKAGIKVQLEIDDHNFFADSNGQINIFDRSIAILSP